MALQTITLGVCLLFRSQFAVTTVPSNAYAAVILVLVKALHLVTQDTSDAVYVSIAVCGVGVFWPKEADATTCG
jgi:hypothetical protein